MKILLPLKDVPIGSIITKKTGEKKYEVRDHIHIQRESGPDDVKSDANTRFLLAYPVACQKRQNGLKHVVNSGKHTRRFPVCQRTG